jgi:hypothetical protein
VSETQLRYTSGGPKAARSAKQSKAKRGDEKDRSRGGWGAFFYDTPSALIGAALRFILESCGTDAASRKVPNHGEALEVVIKLAGIESEGTRQ